MTLNSTEYSPWNPFLPTKRDIERTDELAKKNAIVAGLLTFFLLPFGMVYLNRGINNLKILGYLFLISFVIGFVTYDSNNDKELDEISNFAGLCGQIALVTENVRAVTLARKRQ
ncbi:MAG: hypothetical protein SAK29_09230 [Scytonema sp. PMC 1069.18]|nr:hypothetical protein [Scytonema sp. PMC 1069.18]MEC4881496.1 hypothetical protein [Scytonema sp. PMC 1070.18]